MKSEKTPVVLVVDDQGIVRRAVMRAVSALGYEARGAIDAADAVEQLRTGDDVATVITDYDLGNPERTGAWVLEFVREHRPATHRILMSGRVATDHAIQDALRREIAQGFLAKPIEMAELAEALAAPGLV